MEQYLPIVLLLVLGIAFAAGSFAMSGMLGPKRSTAAKEGPYESGIVSPNPTAARFPVRFFMVAMIFVIFDIEVVFLYPWAVIFHQLGKFGLAEMAAFVVVVFISFAYLVSNGALDWGPALRLATRDPGPLGRPAQPGPGRTLASSVSRVQRPEQLAEDGPAPRPIEPAGPTAAPTSAQPATQATATQATATQATAAQATATQATATPTASAATPTASAATQTQTAATPTQNPPTQTAPTEPGATPPGGTGGSTGA